MRSLQDQIDTTTAHGKFTFRVFTALSEFERDIIRERTKAGVAAAHSRTKRLTKKAQHTAIIAEKLYLKGELTAREICEQLSISKGTLYNFLRHQGMEGGVNRRRKERLR